MKVVSYIYGDFNHLLNERGESVYNINSDVEKIDTKTLVSSSYHFRRSVARFGLDLINVANKPRHIGNGNVLKLLGETYASLPENEPVIYADGADSFFLRVPNVPKDKILYSTEKAIWPPVPSLYDAWEEHERLTPWCYLNGGGYCGPARLLAEFFSRYGLMDHAGDANGQWQQALAYLQAKADGFPIELDQYCLEFQTIGFTEPGDFHELPGTLFNNITGSKPAVIHGNGRTPMGWVYGL